MIRRTLPSHPSGRPIRRSYDKPLSIPRPPRREPLTPGLKKLDGFTEAVGFHINAVEQELEA